MAFVAMLKTPSNSAWGFIMPMKHDYTQTRDKFLAMNNLERTTKRDYLGIQRIHIVPKSDKGNSTPRVKGFK